MKIPAHLEGLSKRDLVRIYLTQNQEYHTLLEKESELLRKENELLREENAQLRKKLEELERRLLAYENAHTPPSKQQRKDHYPKPESSSGKRGALEGHEGTTREQPDPTETKTLNLNVCPDCGLPLGQATHVERRVIEELSNPQPLRVIEFFIPHYECKKCKKEVVPTHAELPKTGRLGNNLQTQIVLAKYEDRLPHRKIANQLNRQYNLNLTPATILDVHKRVARQLEPAYEKIKTEIRTSTRANADETGSRVEGKKWWLWLFMTATSVLFTFRKRREAKVIREILGEHYSGILTVDGLKAYQKIVKLIQRCWAHLLREAKFLSQKHEGQAKVLYESLCELFEKVKNKTIDYETAIQQMNMFLRTAKAYQELRKIAVLLENGLERWFTCLKHADVEPTNNRAEQTLREFVVQRKIYPTFRSEEGPRTAEKIMSVLATWKLQGKNTLQMLRLNLSS